MPRRLVARPVASPFETAAPRPPSLRVMQSRRMGGAKRYPSTPVRVAMGIASLHPSYDWIRLRVLATHCARGLLHHFPPSSNQRAQGRPGACCTRGLACDLRKQNCTRAYRAAGAFRPSLRNGFTAYFVLSPVNGFLPPSSARSFASQDLAPAPRRQDHTTSPYASSAHVSRAFASIASHRAFVTMANAPHLP